MVNPIVPSVNAVGDGASFSNLRSDASNLSEIKLLLAQLITLTRDSIGRRSIDGETNRRSRSLTTAAPELPTTVVHSAAARNLNIVPMVFVFTTTVSDQSAQMLSTLQF